MYISHIVFCVNDIFTLTRILHNKRNFDKLGLIEFSSWKSRVAKKSYITVILLLVDSFGC